ncbi:MAG TPA: NAD(P)-dependent alcohol dehydrogenase [Thermodesulfobacteriota bacterium]|nr:NAD(P)-dependent alcohol dehydrogenase [Thermodesulfobacteriota bacterium]
MKKYVIVPGKKGIDALEVREIAPRQPGPREVSVRVHAASLNYRDLITVNQGVSRELVPFSDGAGTVEETGEEVIRLKKGDRVTGLFFPRWQGGDIDDYKFSSARGGEPTDGMLAQMVHGPEESFIRFPPFLSFEEASTIPCAGLTAWNALVVKGKLKPGETIVIMGTGGVALFALQLARTIGARVILLSGSERKIEKAREMGATEIINYKENPDWEKEVLGKTSGVGADLVLELGGGGTLAKSIAAAKIGGRISLVGVLTGFSGQINPLPILRKTLSVNGIYVGSGEMQEELHRALETNQIHPVIDRVFPFDEAKEAYRYMEGAQHMGKIVVRLD